MVMRLNIRDQLSQAKRSILPIELNVLEKQETQHLHFKINSNNYYLIVYTQQSLSSKKAYQEYRFPKNIHKSKIEFLLLD